MNSTTPAATKDYEIVDYPFGGTYRVARVTNPRNPEQKGWLVDGKMSGHGTYIVRDGQPCPCPARVAICRHLDLISLANVQRAPIPAAVATQIRALAADFDSADTLPSQCADCGNWQHSCTCNPGAFATYDRAAVIATGKQCADELFPAAPVQSSSDSRRQGLTQAATWTDADIDQIVAHEAADNAADFDPYFNPDRARFLHEQTRDWARQQLA